MKSILLLGAGTAAAALFLASTAQAAVVVPSGSPGTTGATALYMNQTGEITVSDPTATPTEILSFLFRPNDFFTGIGEHYVQYDLGSYRLVDGAGQDFNVYEFDIGLPEFDLVDIFVSADGVNFFNVEGSASAAIDLAGDETHDDANMRASYDLAGAVAALGTTEFRFIRIDGTGFGPIDGSAGFDLEAVGIANFRAVPEPGTWAMMLLGFGAIGWSLRRGRGSRMRQLARPATE